MVNTIAKNKLLILNYFKAISGKEKKPELISRFTTDQKLIGHVLFSEKLFPGYELIADQMTAEEDRVVVQARTIGKHTGEAEGIPPTFKTIEIPFAICYQIKNYKIINHWLIADQVDLFEQLGLGKQIS